MGQFNLHLMQQEKIKLYQHF